jgi:transposase-like protein
MNTYGIDLMGRRRRRQHSAEFKVSVIQECIKPGVSMAAVALAHGLNATMVRNWVTESERKPRLGRRRSKRRRRSRPDSCRWRCPRRRRRSRTFESSCSVQEPR